MGKIMVVDDNTVMLGFMTTLLELEDYEAVTVSRPEDIIPATLTEQPDVIIMDVHLAEQDTLAILKELKSDPQLTTIPIIAVSGMDRSEECQAIGVDEFMLKPFMPAKLLEKIEQLRQSRLKNQMAAGCS
ncbi:MAG: response regulator transcription factor [Anaerolineae bacterium]|nr:response regulator transcription factor [Anaerolineae bacterium]